MLSLIVIPQAAPVFLRSYSSPVQLAEDALGADLPEADVDKAAKIVATRDGGHGTQYLIVDSPETLRAAMSYAGPRSTEVGWALAEARFTWSTELNTDPLTD